MLPWVVPASYANSPGRKPGRSAVQLRLLRCHLHASIKRAALDYLGVTQEGKFWIANLYAHVFSEEHRSTIRSVRAIPTVFQFAIQQNPRIPLGAGREMCELLAVQLSTRSFAARMPLRRLSCIAIGGKP
jgi:hypothetical protein